MVEVGDVPDARIGSAWKTGTAAVEIYRDDGRERIESITGDACNVYWVAGRDYDQRRPPALRIAMRCVARRGMWKHNQPRPFVIPCSSAIAHNDANRDPITMPAIPTRRRGWAVADSCAGSPGPRVSPRTSKDASNKATPTT